MVLVAASLGGNQVTPSEDSGSMFGTAFWMLRVSTRDPARRILEAAEDMSLTLDPSACVNARDQLTNPRTRLREEIRWLPGLAPTRAVEIAASHRTSYGEGIKPSRLPTLAKFNLRMAALGHAHEGGDQLDEEIRTLLFFSEDLVGDQILREINEDRAIAQFPPARLEQLEEELTLLKAECSARMLRAVGMLPTSKITSLMTSLAEEYSDDPEKPPPELFATLIEKYEVEAQQFLSPEAENIGKLCEALLTASTAGEAAIEPLMKRLEQVVRRWDSVAQPFQLLAYKRGLDHPASADVGRTLRSLSLDLHNDRDMSKSAERVSELCSEVFAELPEFGDRIREDLDKLIDIGRRRDADSQEHAEWVREMTYEGEVGSFIKYRIAISPAGVEWKDRTLPLEEITAVRWGGTSGRYGTNYSIVLAGPGQAMVIEFGDHSDVFSAITGRVWRSAGVRILLDMLAELRAGKRLQIGHVVIDDVSMVLRERKVFGDGQAMRYAWPNVMHHSQDGELWLYSRDRKARESLSYADINNVHILSALLNLRNEKDTARLSGILGE